MPLDSQGWPGTSLGDACVGEGAGVVRVVGRRGARRQVVAAAAAPGVDCRPAQQRAP